MSDALVRLAEFHGIQPSYLDVDDVEQVAGPDALLAGLRALGVDISTPAEAPDALLRAVAQRWRRRSPPVAAGFGGLVQVEVHVPAGVSGVELELALEDGGVHRWYEDLGARAPDHVAHVDGGDHHAYTIAVRDLPLGYHRLAVTHGGERDETLLVAAPQRAVGGSARRWGVFLPLYALRTERDWGAGDLTDLGELAAWAASLGGGTVGTLPLLPVFVHGSDADPSPYRPVSRLFWNELVLDLARAPEAARVPEARRLLDEAAHADEVARLRALPTVDHAAVAAPRERLLRALSRAFFDEPGDRRGDLEWFITQRPEVEDYALFRGAVARYGQDWRDWPAGPRDGRLDLDTVDLTTARDHLYAQLLAREQVAALSDRLRSLGQEPYLDLPVGTRADGYDVWRHRDVFALGADTGAPPDAIFTGGQNWRFPPLHPQRSRASGYRYLIQVLRHHLELADALRIDHVMGLHRLFWIPEGVDARDGVYVRYPADELYAIVTLESHRHGGRIVGEDLGTVPPEVEERMQAHGLARMYVVQYEVDPEAHAVLSPPSREVVASVNTHDMPTFAAFWQGADIDDGVDLGLMRADEAQQAEERRARTRARLVALLEADGRLLPDDREDPGAVLAALLEWLSASDAEVVLVNLEDLWLETRPQNTPGTGTERVNWRRRAVHNLDEMRDHPSVAATLRRVDRARTV